MQRDCFGLRECLEHRGRQPRVLLGEFAAHTDQMHDRENSGALEIIRCRGDRIGEQPANIRIPALKGRRDSRRNDAVDLAGFEHARQCAVGRRILQPHILRQRNADLFQPAGLD